jgi:hypothetical protein
MARRHIDLIGKKLQHVGTVEAATEQQAIESAVRGIEPALRTKLMATKVRERR